MTYLVVNKNGTIIEKNNTSNNIHDISRNTNNPHVVWKYKKWNIGLFGVLFGKSGTENKFDFPPPLDNTLFFGDCILVNFILKIDGSIDYTHYTDLYIHDWNIIYEKLFGGFESLSTSTTDDDDDTDTDDDDENNIVNKKFSNGYLVDDFLVDDDYISSSYSSDY